MATTKENLGLGSYGADTTHSALPSWGWLLVFAVLLPAAVAGSNQFMFERVQTSPGLRLWLYPWMIVSTAALSWLVGRYLWPAWFRWLVFLWCLALLDLITIAACLSGPVRHYFSYVLVSAQVSVLTLWAILGAANWQWRLPAILPATAVVILFSGIFSSWRYDNWNLLMVLVAVVIVLLCGLLRWSGFLLRYRNDDALAKSDRALSFHQFGMKHMIAWMTAMVPILIVFRGFDFFVFKRLGGQGTFPLALFALTLATVNMVAIWSVLGGGHWTIRLAALLAIPLILAAGMLQFMNYLHSTNWNMPLPNRWYDSLVYGIVESRDTWISWVCLDAALLAALLLFLRASGYRLIRKIT
jgi:hypothetical protein